MKLKSYAEKHTALFTAIFSALIASTTVYLQLCYYVYNYGKLSYFNIDVNTVRLVKDSNKFNILFYIIISAVMLAMNYFGYYFYRKNSLFKYFCGLFPLSLFMSVFLFDYTCKFRFIYSILYKPCIFKAYRLLNVQTLCIFPCFCPYEPKQGKFLFSADYLIQQSCGSTLRFPCSVSVNVHCGTDISVSEKFLHIFRCCTV